MWIWEENPLSLTFTPLLTTQQVNLAFNCWTQYIHKIPVLKIYQHKYIVWNKINSSVSDITIKDQVIQDLMRGILFFCSGGIVFIKHRFCFSFPFSQSFVGLSHFILATVSRNVQSLKLFSFVFSLASKATKLVVD